MKQDSKLIIFDLDGTIYKLDGGSYKKSSLRRGVLRNAVKFIGERLSRSEVEAQNVLRTIKKKYGEQISIGLEREFGIDRHDYFNTVWDIPARDLVTKKDSGRKILLALRREYEMALVSDAPRVWINNVLKELGIKTSLAVWYSLARGTDARVLVILLRISHEL